MSQVYIEWENQAKQRGIEQERRSVIENLMQLRFGSIDQDLRAIITQWMNLDKTEHTRLILQLAQLSKAELIQYFKTGQCEVFCREKRTFLPLKAWNARKWLKHN